MHIELHYCPTAKDAARLQHGGLPRYDIEPAACGACNARVGEVNGQGETVTWRATDRSRVGQRRGRTLRTVYQTGTKAGRMTGMTEPNYRIQPTEDWRTGRFDELDPQDLIGLIGKTVHIGVYTKDGEPSISITGTVHVVLDETRSIGRVSVEFQSTTNTPPNIKWSTEDYYAVLTWNAA